MQMNRFWASVWSVAAFLFGVGLLQYIVGKVATLFGLLPGGVTIVIALLAGIVVPVVGALTYIDWKWGWKPEHVGLARCPAAVGWVLLGLTMGAAAGLLSHTLSGVISGTGFSLPALGTLDPTMLISMLLATLSAFAIELCFRGVAISRYQADLTPREVLAAATLTPFAWILVQSLFRFGGPPVGISDPADAAMSVFLSLLFLRTDSVWLSTGLRAGAMGTLYLAHLNTASTGGLVLWSTAAAILLAMEWFKQERMPKRVQPRGTQRTFRDSRTIRGPWGPH